MTAQTAVQSRAGELGMDERMGDRQQVVQGQQEGLTQGHHNRLLSGTQCGVELMEAMRSIFRAFALAPFRHRVAVEVVRSSQRPVADRRSLCLQFQTDGR
uniref:Uncharacterized protein n=1 Tax=Candidatus Kentrum sp. LFY TaxID=2126342 RepID=A0A450WUC0_9GAMM|nr:MAG: hypothetical protein BECKLFY1418C_GA0070996_10773 [Candidatus Kentron sp. LFY]